MLCRAGFTDEDVADAAFVFNTYVTGFVLDETHGPHPDDGSVEERANEGRQWFQSLPQEQFPRLVSLSAELFDPNPERRFEFGLQMLLDGLEGRKRRAKPRGKRPES